MTCPLYLLLLLTCSFLQRLETLRLIIGPFSHSLPSEVVLIRVIGLIAHYLNDGAIIRVILVEENERLTKTKTLGRNDTRIQILPLPFLCWRMKGQILLNDEA